MNVVIIGSGNVANVLGHMILNSRHNIMQVVSPELAHAKLLADDLHCAYTNKISNINRGADLYLIAITDCALPGLKNHLSLGSSIVVHTAGSVPCDVLNGISLNYGVLYPLQSLYRGMDLSVVVPLLIDGNSATTVHVIGDFARTLSSLVSVAHDAERLKLHVAAVLVNNFTNHLYAMAETFCSTERIDFNMLKPLIRETANRITTQSALSIQTGPAKRKDRMTIEKHLSLLSMYPEIRDIYIKMTDSIMGK